MPCFKKTAWNLIKKIFTDKNKIMAIVTKKELSPKFSKLLDKLNAASDRKQMHMLLDHPWDVTDEKPWLKKKEALSIYGTPYYDLASEEELRRLSVYETGAWWHTFVIFENLVSEYYMKIVNHGTLKKFPEVVKYIHHFCREEITHALVFRKAMAHFKIDVYPTPFNLKEFYTYNSTMKEMPLKAIYMTILIEWLAENNALIDCNNDFVSPLARSVAVEHHKEEARHIEWGKNMIREFIEIVPGFIEEARSNTAPMLRSILDMAVVSPVVFDRVGFENPEFKNFKKLFPTILESEARAEINSKIMAPMIRFFIEIGVCDANNIEDWKKSRFDKDIEKELQRIKDKPDPDDGDNVMNTSYKI
jgi:hypothetical protein